MTITAPRRIRQLAVTPTRRGQTQDLDQLQDQLDQLIRSFFRDPFGAAGSNDQTPVWVPAGDIEETDDAYVVELDVPGVRREDVNIQLRDNEVRITGEVRQRERTGVLRRQTRRVGQFDYQVMLPGDVNPDQVEATLRDGVLVVRIGKARASQPRQVEIKD